MTNTQPDNIVIDYGNGNIFDAEQAINSTVDWIRDFFDETGGKIAVIGISGGKDSSVVAALCARALGSENVIGVKMSDGGQDDWRDQDELISHLGIRHIDFNIGDVTQAMRDTAADVLIAVPGWHNESYNDVPENMWDTPEVNREMSEKADKEDDFGILQNDYELPRQAAINMPARIRMTVLYMVAQSLRDSSRVMNTCNLSEDWIGWSTRYGDSAGDFSPLAGFTATEVTAMARVLGLPEHLCSKPPADGLSGRTDEDNFGFAYAELDDYIRRGADSDARDEVREKIDEMHVRNEFKMHMPPACPSGLAVMAG